MYRRKITFMDLLTDWLNDWLIDPFFFTFNRLHCWLRIFDCWLSQWKNLSIFWKRKRMSIFIDEYGNILYLRVVSCDSCDEINYLIKWYCKLPYFLIFTWGKVQTPNSKLKVNTEWQTRGKNIQFGIWNLDCISSVTK